MTFKKAERKQAKLKIALTGPSGSGKSFSALLMASAIGKRIAVIDTENGSASLYADISKGPLSGIEFDVLNLEPPYTIQKYTEAIEAAEKAGYDVLVIDGISPAWAGEGGLLSKKEALDQRGGNSYTNWAGITKEHEIFKARLLNCDIHLICTMRSKQDYVLEVNEKGKSAPKKVGMAPIQRDGMEYEFTTVFDLAMDHNAVASKDRTSLFDGQIFKPTAETGKRIMAWLMGGKPAQKPVAAPQAPPKADPKVQAGKPADPAQGGQPGDFPGEPEGGSTNGQITQDQLNRISEGINRLKALGIMDSTIWKGIVAQVTKVHNRAFAEPSELMGAEGNTVLNYLAAWELHLNTTMKAPRAGKEA
jgi:hypothetical protein